MAEYKLSASLAGHEDDVSSFLMSTNPRLLKERAVDYTY
jgi:hypothetical protein